MAKQVFAIFMWLIAISFVSACSEQKLSPLSTNAKVVAFGDSLTDGVGVSRAQSYPTVLAQMTGLNVINEGISGETTKQGLARFESVLEQYQPELVILLEGGNDILRNLDLSQTKNNLAQMIEIAQSRHVQIIFLGVPEKNIFSDSADFYGELAQQYDLVFSEDLVASLIKKQRYKSDPIHFNQLGYQKLAEGIKELLEDNGAL